LTHPPVPTHPHPVESRRPHLDRREAIRIVAAALAGALLLSAVILVGLERAAQTTVFPGLNGCIPPCPHSTVDYDYDWLTGTRTAIIVTRDVDGSLMSERVVEASGRRYELLSVLAVPVIVGGLLGLVLATWVIRRQRTQS